MFNDRCRGVKTILLGDLNIEGSWPTKSIRVVGDIQGAKPSKHKYLRRLGVPAKVFYGRFLSTERPSTFHKPFPMKPQGLHLGHSKLTGRTDLINRGGIKQRVKKEIQQELLSQYIDNWQDWICDCDFCIGYTEEDKNKVVLGSIY